MKENWRESLHPDPSGQIKPSHCHIWRLSTEPRRIPEGAKIRLSVIERMNNPDNRYHPANLPESFVEVE